MLYFADDNEVSICKKKCYEFLNYQQVIKTFVIYVIRNVIFPTAGSPLELPWDNSSATLQEKGTNAA